jgi:hypothetical protein
MMCHELLRLEFSGQNRLQEHRGRDSIDQAGRERDVMRPKFVQIQLHRLAVDADVRDMAAGGDDSLAGIEAFWETDGFDSNVNPSVLGEAHYCFRRAAVGVTDDEASSPLHRQFQTILIAVNHDNPGR